MSTTVSPLRLSPRVVARCVLVAFVALLSTGCLSGEAELTVGDDGSGTITVEVFPPGRMTDEVDADDLAELFESPGNDIEVAAVDKDGVEGYRIVVPFDDYRDVGDALDASPGAAGVSAGLITSLSIVELPDGDGWEFSATLGSAPGSVTGWTELDALIAGEAGSGFDFSVTLPGNVLNSNADSTDGGTATWRLDDAEAPATLRMRTEPAPLITPFRVIVGGAALVVLLGVVLFMVGASRPQRASRRERRRLESERPPSPTSTAGWARSDSSPEALPPISS